VLKSTFVEGRETLYFLNIISRFNYLGILIIWTMFSKVISRSCGGKWYIDVIFVFDVISV